jgi:hypothetical protein
MHILFSRRALAGGCLAFALIALPAIAAAQAPPSGSNPPAAGVEPEGLLPEPGFVDKALTSLPRRLGLGSGDSDRSKSGFYPELGNMPTGAGWISAGPGYRQWLLGGRALVDGSAALSWRAYKMMQARLEVPGLAAGRVAVGTQVRWQDLTQVTYFGEGTDSLESNRSEYRLKSTQAGGYASVKPREWLTIGGRAEWLDRPSILSHAGKFQRGNPDTRELFGEDIVYTVDGQPAFLHGQLGVTVDTRNSRSHPARGAMYRASAAAYSDRDTGAFSFRRYEAEAAQFVPLAGERVVFALHGWVVGSETAAGSVIPFYLQPSLGGGNTLRAYTDYRFHDRNLLIVNVESRIALFTHIDAALFVDAGNVASRFSDLNVDKRAYGFGLRAHTRNATFARVDIAHGEEGWNLLVRMSDPLHLTRLSRRAAPIPFVP